MTPFRHNVLFSFIRQRFSQNYLPDNTTVEVWNQLCEPLFEHTERKQSAGRAWIAQGYDECVALGVFSYGDYSMFEHPWPTLDAVKPMIERWVEEFGESARYYTPLTVFLANAGQGLFPDPALEWLHRIVIAKKANQRFWLANDNGSRTAVLIAQLLDTHEDAITGDPGKVTQLVEMSDILIATGVRQASQVQQRLAALSKREP